LKYFRAIHPRRFKNW